MPSALNTSIRGRYRDFVYECEAGLIFDSGWLSNTIANSAWPLIAGLLKNDPRLAGILFCAVGAGNSAWDGTHTSPSSVADQLEDEIDRVAVPIEDIVYLDSDETPVEGPTTRIRVSVNFQWTDQDQTLREFGLFGGDASQTKDSGYLINHVIHPRIDLVASETLTRQIWLTLRPDIHGEWPEPSSHWLGSASVEEIDGVGSAYSTALADALIETIGDLAGSEPTALETDIPLMKLVELRAKARLAVNTAERISPVSELLDRSAWEVIATPTSTLAAEAAASSEEVQRLREQVEMLQLAMDNRFLRRSTIGELARSQ